MAKKIKIEKPKGKLGILMPGLGAVATTAIAGVIAVNKGLGLPIGSLSQMGRMRVGKRTENKQPFIKDVIELQSLKNVVFGGWDIFEDNVYESAKHAGVLEESLLKKIKPQLEKIKPMKAVLIMSTSKDLMASTLKKVKPKWNLLRPL